MDFIPIIPTDLRGNISEALMIKSEMLLEKSAALAGSHTPQLIDTLREHLLTVNSYYSNMIESEGTRISDIERAMKNDYSSDEKTQKLQRLSVAHIDVQKEIMASLKNDTSISPYSRSFILDLHKRFYIKKGMGAFLDLSTDNEKVIMVPGAFRTGNVAIGDHQAPDAASVESLMGEFEHLYAFGLTKRRSLQLIYALASHHRLTWIHPFLDGNGRTSRLTLDAIFAQMELPGYGLWNISRGLARDQKEYRSHLRQADTPRQGDYDGKGSLTAKGLEQFVDYMLDTAIDQVNYMGNYLRLDGLAKRIELFVMRINDGLVPSEPKPLPAHADKIFKHLLLHGECTRGEVRKVVGKSESLATKLTKHLLEREFVVSDTPRGAIRLKINASMASYLFPELVPEEI